MRDVSIEFIASAFPHKPKCYKHFKVMFYTFIKMWIKFSALNVGNINCSVYVIGSRDREQETNKAWQNNPPSPGSPLKLFFFIKTATSASCLKIKIWFM